MIPNWCSHSASVLVGVCVSFLISVDQHSEMTGINLEAHNRIFSVTVVTHYKRFLLCEARLNR